MPGVPWPPGEEEQAPEAPPVGPPEQEAAMRAPLATPAAPATMTDVTEVKFSPVDQPRHEKTALDQSPRQDADRGPPLKRAKADVPRQSHFIQWIQGGNTKPHRGHHCQAMFPQVRMPHGGLVHSGISPRPMRLMLSFHSQQCFPPPRVVQETVIHCPNT